MFVLSNNHVMYIVTCFVGLEDNLLFIYRTKRSAQTNRAIMLLIGPL